jgi:hypothetical protein
MSSYFILATMIFLHILDDYGLQASCLCDLKQKGFWEKNAPSKLYKYDYIWALLMHGFSWSFMIMLPVAIAEGFNVDLNFFIIMFLNAGFHAKVDDLKANKFAINLWADQLYHMVQIGATFMLYLSEVI